MEPNHMGDNLILSKSVERRLRLSHPIPIEDWGIIGCSWCGELFNSQEEWDEHDCEEWSKEMLRRQMDQLGITVEGSA